ncbi:MAG: potassium-transporting ATPase subunit KdpB [Chloroflexi bacterium]|nr:potassium-transporting ATPase subunit KdpB [Chloroflexota bacterium]
MKRAVGARRRGATFDRVLLRQAVGDAFHKLNPQQMVHNPVMFVVEVGSTITTIQFVRELLSKALSHLLFTGQITLWLWFTVLFANFAEAVAEARGKAQADSLRRTRQQTTAKLLQHDGSTRMVNSTMLRKGDEVLVEINDLIPGDGEVIEGVAYVNEAAITGESAPVLKEPGTDIRSSVTGGTQVISDWIKVRITSNPGETFLDRMISLVEGAKRQRTPNEIALSILLAGLTIIFLLVVVTLQPFAIYAGKPISSTILIALLVCLIPTTIGGLLSAIGIAGMDRVTRFNVLATSGRAVEAAGDVNTLLLDKTGTITFGNRLASEFLPTVGVSQERLVRASLLSSLADDTPEGKSIVALARQSGLGDSVDLPSGAEFIPFTAQTRMSGIRCDGTVVLKGAVDAIRAQADTLPEDLQGQSDRIAREGGTPLAVMDGRQILGLIYLKDTVKPGMRTRFDELRRLGIRTVMITGDNRLTAATIAREAGVDDFVAEAKPEDKMRLIKEEQAQGKLVAMTGDGTNDAPALAQADVGLAMNSGTQAAKEAGNMVDLDSDPTKLIEVVLIGKQLLITRGAITTFSIANDVAKYFAIIPAMFTTTYPALGALNVMRLATPQSAILSAVIFNALIIVALIPLALCGVSYRAVSSAALLRRNLLIYGLGGIVAPFIGIKVIDLIIAVLHLA